MATVSHTIYSRYAPKKRQNIEIQTIQASSEVDPWETESAFPARRLEPPRFVPATSSSTEYSRQPAIADGEAGNNLAGWYRSLTGMHAFDSSQQQSLYTTAATLPSSSHCPDIPKRRAETQNKNTWFIHRVIQSEPSTASSIPPPTLADILARDPPPLPTEAPFITPVWLALGPSNKGFAMLQRKGWTEGEGLGSQVRRRAHIDGDFMDRKDERAKRKTRKIKRQPSMKKEERGVGWDEDVQEIRNVDVIDLTLSDSEEDASELEDAEHEFGCPLDTLDTIIATPSMQPHSSHSPTALLTPIATVLKSDRLGIGLKAKTTGPYKASQKRITHSAAAVTAHIRAAENTRKEKAKMGRGRRGFAKIARKEEQRRKQMLAYLNE